VRAWRTATYHGAMTALDEQTNDIDETHEKPTR